jgi:hypothetical protein
MLMTFICWSLEAWSLHWWVNNCPLALLKLNACNLQLKEAPKKLDLNNNNNKFEREISGNIDS